MRQLQSYRHWKTKQHSKTRYCEHFGISDLTGKTVKTIKQSAISDHRKTCHSRIDFNAFTTLGRDKNNNWHLLLKESLFIQRDNPVMNAQVASVPLKLFSKPGRLGGSEHIFDDVN